MDTTFISVFNLEALGLEENLLIVTTNFIQNIHNLFFLYVIRFCLLLCPCYIERKTVLHLS